MNGFEICRLKAGLTQVQASKALNVSQSAICFWEKGYSYPMGDKIPAIAKLYGCEISDLYENAQPNKKRPTISRRQRRLMEYYREKQSKQQRHGDRC